MSDRLSQLLTVGWAVRRITLGAFSILMSKTP